MIKNQFLLMLLILGISLNQTFSLAQNVTALKALPNSNDLALNLIIQTKDHVNIFSGNVFFLSTDFLISSKGPKLALIHNYNSLSTYNGMSGYGWRTDFDVNLTQDGKGNVTVVNEDGKKLYFTEHSGTFISSTGDFYKLTQNTDYTFTLTDKNGIVTIYGVNGRMTSRADRKGNTLTFIYNPAQYGGTYIQDAAGNQITLYFDFHGRISSVVGSKGKNFQYNYDENGNLVNVINPEGLETDYDYNSKHQIIQITKTNGHKVYYQYDNMGRVELCWKDDISNKVTFYYGDNNTTVVTDSLGKHTYKFNDTGSLMFADSTLLAWGIKMDQY